MSYQNQFIGQNNVIGNISQAEENYEFKQEVKGVYESYAAQGVDLTEDLAPITRNATSRQGFVDALCESFGQDAIMTNDACVNSAFYGNYTERTAQLIENTMVGAAVESVMDGYSPITAYSPFFVKKQWIDCMFKDYIMTEIPKTPVINIGFEKRYAKDMEGNRYSLPEALYDEATVKKLLDAATGINCKSDEVLTIAEAKAFKLLSARFFPGYVDGDPSLELTPNMLITSVIMTDTVGTTHTVPCSFGIDPSTKAFITQPVVFTTPGATPEELKDELFGKVDFINGTVSLGSGGVITGVTFTGKLSNRFNQRGLDVVREVERIEKMMPESGPRLNTAITIEEAANALALQQIDIISDNINIMGSTLAALEDAEISMYLKNSYEAQKLGQQLGVKYNDIGDNTMISEATFNTLPYDGYSINEGPWLATSREYFERLIGDLKKKLRSSNIIIAAIAHPNIIRYLQNDINWVFSSDTQISGVKLAYNFGIYTSAQDRVHILTSLRLSEDDGIRFIVIPVTKELMTFKHYKYNVAIDRNYRHPQFNLVPNIMCTQRTLTFEILPVQGLMKVEGREMVSPATLVRP